MEATPRAPCPFVSGDHRRLMARCERRMALLVPVESLKRGDYRAQCGPAPNSRNEICDDRDRLSDKEQVTLLLETGGPDSPVQHQSSAT